MFKIVFRDSSLYPKQLSLFCLLLTKQRMCWPHWLHCQFLQHDKTVARAEKTAVVEIEAFGHLIMSQQGKRKL